MRLCEGCGYNGDRKEVYMTNGVLVLCARCLDDINRKNPVFAIMQKHGLGVVKDTDGWWAVRTYKPDMPDQRITIAAFPDPMTAVMEANKYIENLTKEVFNQAERSAVSYEQANLL